jgi:hypothetical protein
MFRLDPFTGHDIYFIKHLHLNVKKIWYVSHIEIDQFVNFLMYYLQFLLHIVFIHNV